MTRVTTRTSLPATHQGPPAHPPLSMAEWQARDRSDRRFHLGIRAYMLFVTLGAAAVAMGWVSL